MTFDSTTFPGRVRMTRFLRGLSQGDLATLVRVDVKTVTRWESGKSFPTAGASFRLATAIRVLPLWLLTGEGPMEAPEMPKPPVPAEGLASSNSGR